MIYKPAISKAGLNPIRADDLYKTGSIINDLWELTKSAKILLADLSGKNPNVFYELGLAHAIAKPVVQITDNIEDIPFDLRTLRVIPYDKNEGEWGEELRKSITIAIKETLAHPGTSILPTFLQSQSTKRPKRFSSEKKKVLELSQEIDSLRNQMITVSRGRERMLSSKEVEFRLREYHNRKFPRILAVQRVISAGANPSMVEYFSERIWGSKRKR